MELFCESHGDGPPVVCLPGLGTDLTCFAFQVPDLARDFRVVLVDLRGVGRSPAPPGPYSCEEMAGDVARLLERLDLGPALVIGHSMGAAVAQHLARSHPERVAGLVLAGAFARLDPFGLQVLEGWQLQQEAGISRELFARSFLPWVLSRGFFEHPEFVREAVRLVVETPWPQAPEAFSSQAAACRAFDSRPWLGELRAPVRVISGTEDLIAPLGGARFLAEALPSARLHALEGLAHACMSEGAPLFNPLVRDFAGELQSSGTFPSAG